MMLPYQRPRIVPALQLEGLPDYVSTSEDEEEENGNEAATAPTQQIKSSELDAAIQATS